MYLVNLFIVVCFFVINMVIILLNMFLLMSDIYIYIYLVFFFGVISSCLGWLLIREIVID